ncbi:hypothetical protein JHK87_036697 [Glycine soja]|nr:hypothetical protein JHK87_036697 [Glycine soja]
MSISSKRSSASNTAYLTSSSQAFRYRFLILFCFINHSIGGHLLDVQHLQQRLVVFFLEKSPEQDFVHIFRQFCGWCAYIMC